VSASRGARPTRWCRFCCRARGRGGGRTRARARAASSSRELVGG
jgi:hypothetical protein